MQPVLLGRSFAPLQGETGLCTAEIPSNHQTTMPPKDYGGGKDKGIHLALQQSFLLVLGRRCGKTRWPDCSSSRKQIHSCNILSAIVPSSSFSSRSCVCQFRFWSGGSQQPAAYSISLGNPYMTSKLPRECFSKYHINVDITVVLLHSCRVCVCVCVWEMVP